MKRLSKFLAVLAIITISCTLFVVPASAETAEMGVLYQVKEYFNIPIIGRPSEWTERDYGYITVQGPLPAYYTPGTPTVREYSYWNPFAGSTWVKETTYTYYVQNGINLYVH